MKQSKAKVAELLADLNKKSQEATNSGLIDKEKYVVPPHLHDLQENDLPETQRGLVMTEIAQFRERAAKREREKMRDVQQAMPIIAGAPSGPKQREWGKPQFTGSGGGGPGGNDAGSPQGQGFGKGAQGYSKPVGFVKAGTENKTSGSDSRAPGKTVQTDEELEAERREARRQDEEASFRDVSAFARGACVRCAEVLCSGNDGMSLESVRGSRRWSALLPESERRRRRRNGTESRCVHALMCGTMTRVTSSSTQIGKPSITFKVACLLLNAANRPRWRALRARRLAAEEAADAESRAYEDREAENLRRESEQFLARQMDEMQALQDEQRKAGLLLDDGAPVKLNVSLAAAAPHKDTGAKDKAAVFGQDEEEEENLRKRKAPMPKLDLAEGGEKAKEKLAKIRSSVPRDKESLFKAKVRWDGLSDVSAGFWCCFLRSICSVC